MEIDSVSYLKFLFALVFVIGLIGGVALLAKRFGIGTRGPMRRAKGNRLSIVENMQIDAKRRVILIRRDQKEYLLLVGGVTDLVIESDIPVAPKQEIEGHPSPKENTFAENFKEVMRRKKNDRILKTQD